MWPALNDRQECECGILKVRSRLGKTKFEKKKGEELTEITTTKAGTKQQQIFIPRYQS